MREADAITKIFFVALIAAAAYLAVSIAIRLLAPQPQGMYGMMQQVAGQQPAIQNTLALVIALGIGLLASMRLKPKNIIRHWNSKQKALSIVRKKLSGDERQMLKEIEKAGTITQDSLRARLGWSKAKTSTILTRLDRMNLIQRERQGKTYRVFLAKDFK